MNAAGDDCVIFAARRKEPRQKRRKPPFTAGFAGWFGR